jgi:hypothetical protein
MEKGFEEYLASLDHLKIDNLPLYYSSDCKSEAEMMGKVTSQAYEFLQIFFKEKPEIILLVLNEADWKKRVSHQPYGDPFVPDVRVHYGVKPPDRWKETFTFLSSKAPADLRRKLVLLSGLESRTVKEAIERVFTLEFFAATVAHEIAHPFLGLNLVLPQPIDFEYAFKLDTFWLAEFLPQYAMYSFLQATDKPLCEKWLLLMKSAFEGGKGRMQYSDLKEMGIKYPVMIKSCIENILWYQAKLFVMAADLYSQYGEGFLKEATESLRVNERLLINQLEQSFGNFQVWLRNWK